MKSIRRRQRFIFDVILHKSYCRLRLLIYPLCFPDAFRGIIISLPYSVTNTILIITIIISLYHKLQVTICNFIFNLVYVEEICLDVCAFCDSWAWALF